MKYLKKIGIAIVCLILTVCLLSACSLKKDSLDIEGSTSGKASESESQTQEETTAGETYIVDTSADGNIDLNMRSSPEILDGNIVAAVPNGTKLVVTQKSGDWVYTAYNGVSGWVHAGKVVPETGGVTEETDAPTVKVDAQPGTTAGKTASSSKTNASSSSYPWAYAGYNPKVVAVSSSEWNLTLVNCSRRLPDGYKPKLAAACSGSGETLDYRVAPYYQKMFNAAAADGIYLTPVSGYRSYDIQKRNFENKISYYMNQGHSRVDATKMAANSILLPATSEHNAGLAMDICSLETSFENTKAFRWLQENAQNYGFILRYPKAENKQKITQITYEPWHWRYVGVDAAKAMKASGQTLEEYLGIYID